MADSLDRNKCAPVVVESYLVTLFSPKAYTEEQVKDIIEKALESAGSDLACVGVAFGWKM